MTDADLLPRVETDMDTRCVTTVRMLAVDMVEQAKSGHPGLPLGAAPMAWALWSRFLRHDPSTPDWPDRDRFVLSAGHGSALLYALLHLFGYPLKTEDLRAFRQLGSRTPGHPEHGQTPGVEVTTGPLGQGIATAVGLALAERLDAAHYNSDPNDLIVDHRTFVLCSDGDLMEGVSAEASSLAGHLGLGRLVVLYDDNRISIDGPTSLAFTEDVAARYRSYNWGVFEVEDGNDVDAIATAIARALADENRPSFIRVHTTIGFGAPTKAGSEKAHGAPLGPKETALLREGFGWPEKDFFVPEDVRRHTAALGATGRLARERWEQAFLRLSAAEPERAEEWNRRRTQVDAAGVLGAEVEFATPAVSTRSASGKVLAALAHTMPGLVGGSADLTESTCVGIDTAPVSPGSFAGRQIHFGVREHAMAATCNGIALHGGFRVFASTFLVFSDYARPALRMAALMGLPVVHLYTHDSIGLGEDGPTHQPVEHLAALRAIPNVAVLRPADANETTEAWRVALARRSGPTVLALSRQNLPLLPRGPAGWIARKGARAIHHGEELPDVAIVATGSEVALALRAAEQLDAKGTVVRVVSMPWRERFVSLPEDEQRELLPEGVPVLVVEAGVSQGWETLTAKSGTLLCLDRFGTSGKGTDVQSSFGFSPQRIEALASALASRRSAAVVGGAQ